MPIMEISRSNLAVDSGFSSSRNIAHYAEYYCRAISLARPNTTRTQPDTAGHTTRHNTQPAPLRCTPTASCSGSPASVPAPRQPAKLQTPNTFPKLRSRSASSCRWPLRHPVACARPCDHCDHLRQSQPKESRASRLVPSPPFAARVHVPSVRNQRTGPGHRPASRSQLAARSFACSSDGNPLCTLSAACPLC
ncbi:hypothetical protein B0T14DRAFT_191494 [Immersiella caudata]|uniref:Uncharacterized protein n=1 Tax=Immersiella caudata TaxID=314043 RepID=A0AA39WYG1_9PEZI|nr:hypothetical protein B0T14DRAFT_191494 [Immersiella caudata]